MSTAHRPTWASAIGGTGLRDGATSAPTHQYSAKDLPGHTKLKYRQTGQDNPEEISTKSFRLPESTDKTELEESQNLDIDISVEEEISSVLSNESDGDHFDDVSVEDETELLMRELEKIKREREEARKAEEVKTDLEAIHGNPLLAPEPSFSVKRRWDDDVVFKNQYKGLDNTAKKRFINDTTRSDFHRKFLDKYIK